MIWHNPTKLVKKYKERDFRIIRRFALTPTQIGEKAIWLQSYVVLQGFYMYQDRDILGRLISTYLKWQDVDNFVSIQDLKVYLKTKKAQENHNMKLWERLLGRGKDRAMLKKEYPELYE